jgi:acyl carrier protein
MNTSTLDSTRDLITGLLVDELEAEPASVRPEALMLDLLPDSLMRVDLAVQLQEKLGIKLEDGDLKSLTLEEFVSRVDGLRAA